MDAISELTAKGVGTAKTPEKELSSDGFMKLLLTQLKMQSPTSPLDSATMMQQISQLTSLSSAKELQKSVQHLQESFGANQAIEAAQLVGRKVQIPADEAKLVAGSGMDGATVVPAGAEKVTITIRDSNDKIIKSIPLTAYSAGVVDFNWDGTDLEGKLRADGFYKMSASAEVDGETVDIPTAASFDIKSVAVDRSNNSVILNVEGLGGVSMKDVIKFL